MYQKAKAILSEMWEIRRAAFVETTTAYYDQRIAEATKQGGSDRAAKLAKERDSEIKRYTQQIHELKGPYFPLLRFGDKVATSKAFDAMETALADLSCKEYRDAAKKLDTMKTQGAHYAVQAFDRTSADGKAQQTTTDTCGRSPSLRIGHQKGWSTLKPAGWSTSANRPKRAV